MHVYKFLKFAIWKLKTVVLQTLKSIPNGRTFFKKNFDRLKSILTHWNFFSHINSHFQKKIKFRKIGAFGVGF